MHWQWSREMQWGKHRIAGCMDYKYNKRHLFYAFTIQSGRSIWIYETDSWLWISALPLTRSCVLGKISCTFYASSLVSSRGDNSTYLVKLLWRQNGILYFMLLKLPCISQELIWAFAIFIAINYYHYSYIQ